MSEPSSAEVVLWQQLGKYLKTEMEVSKPEIISYPAHANPARKSPHEVIHFKVRFSNTAPDRPDCPRVVLTGLGLGILCLHKPRASLSFHGPTDEPDWAAHGSWVERPEHNRQSYPVVGASRKRWDEVTADESAQGMALFPGESATLEVVIPVDDIQKHEFHIMGSVSRRHFFHYDRIVRIPPA
jgi:hypothetical protein